jgi:hypothetical protein
MPSPQGPEPHPTNDVEIRAYGLMRSGNHAIIDWIQNQYPRRPTCFLNNVKHGAFDPYLHCRQRVLTNIDDDPDTESLRQLRKALLIYSYEDREDMASASGEFLQSVFSDAFETRRQIYLGTSARQFDLMIIRDPFNCFASRVQMIQAWGSVGGVTDPTLIGRNWKSLATKALSLIERPEPGQLVVTYNQWATAREYRAQLSKALSGDFNDQSFHRLSSFGGGSSFPDTMPPRITVYQLLTQAHKLFSFRRYTRFSHYLRSLTMTEAARRRALFSRWRLLSENATYRSLFLDKEILALSERLFGEIPGTRNFVHSIQRTL